jgi:CRISPR-associated endoribonuclease Cas6/Csy4 subtype I-F
MITHYVHIDILGRPTDKHFLCNRLLKVIHGILSAHFQGQIGMGFPYYKKQTEENVKASLGDRVTLFGNNKALEFITHQPKIIDLAEANVIQIKAIENVPNDPSWVRYTRNRQIEKTGKNYLERCIRRRERRGTPISSANSEKHKIEKDSLPFIQLSSSSNKNQYLLYVDQTQVMEPCLGTFTKYGLSSNGSTVPFIA